MTREEAIKILKSGNNRECAWSEYCEAYNMAIQALEQEPILDKIRAEIQALSPKSMADIELVIKIPERIHYGIEKGITVNGSQASQILIDAVKNGTPLTQRLWQIKDKITEKFNDRPSGYNHRQRIEFYNDVMKIIGNHICGINKDV